MGDIIVTWATSFLVLVFGVGFVLRLVHGTLL